MNRILFPLILFLQLMAFSLIIGYFARLAIPGILTWSVLAYGLSLLMLIYAIIIGSKGILFNCVSVTLILVNIMLYITILYTRYLSDFLGSMKV